MACFDFVGIRLLQGVCLCCYNYSCTDDKHGILLQVWAVSVYTCAKNRLGSLLLSAASPILQGAAADRFFHSLSSFIQGLDTKNNVKVSTHTHTCTHETAVIQQHVALDITVKPPWSIPSTVPLLNLQLAHKMCSTQPTCYLCWVCHR